MAKMTKHQSFTGEKLKGETESPKGTNAKVTFALGAGIVVRFLYFGIEIVAAPFFPGYKPTSPV